MPNRSKSVAQRWIVALVVVVAGALLSLVLYSRANDGASGASSTLAVGAIAPDVRLPASDGSTVDLQAARGKRNVLLYYYEHAG